MTQPPRPDSGRLAVLLASARERLADAHLVHSLDFIQRTSGEVEAPRALEIYCRLHRLDEQDTRALKNRVLASFGQGTAAESISPHTFVAVGGDVEWDVTASLFYRLRRRLGGRRNARLRRWVELHTGYVEGKLLRVHVDNVERLLEVTGTSDGAIADTIHIYMRSLRLRDSLFEALDIAVCERLYPDITHTSRKVTLRVQRGGA
jgi:hypothetical protein